MSSNISKSYRVQIFGIQSLFILICFELDRIVHDRPNIAVSYNKHIIRLINGKYDLPCFALLILLVDTAKIPFEELTLVSGTKQRSQADKADRLTRQAGKAGLSDLFKV